MRRRTSLAAALAVGTAWAASACGIPTDDDPEVVGDAPTDFGESSDTSGETFLPTQLADETVENFLKAAAGDPVSRDDRLNAFTVTDQQFSEASAGINLLDDVEVSVGDGNPNESATVTVTGTVIGLYLDDGSVRMNSAPREYSETFTLQRESFSDAWAIAGLPTQVALDYGQFVSSYGMAPLYFQAGQSTLLVPDLRWMYDDLDAETSRRLLLDWLLLGPSDFASQSARSAIPTGTAYTAEDGVAAIDLTLGETVDDDTADAIAAQVAWSLNLTGGFTLTADGDTIADGDLDDWRGWNAIPPDLPQIAYFIAEDTVWEYTSSQQVTTSSADHPWVGFSVAGLRQVAVGSGDQIAAVVSGADGDVLQTGTSESSMQKVADLGGDLADPQWHQEDTLFVIDDGVPTVVEPVNGAVQTLPVGDQVTAMSLSADGRRLAFVEDAIAWVAPLGVDADGNVQAGETRRIGLDIEDVTDVAWSSENYLWVAGRRDDDTLFRVALDNSRTEVQAGTSGLLFDQIAANPADPVESDLNRGEPVLVVANETLYRVHTGGPEGVRNGDAAVDGTAPFTVLQ